MWYMCSYGVLYVVMKEIIYNMPEVGRCYNMRIGGHISSDAVTKKNYLSIRMSLKHTHSIKKVSYFFNITRCRLMKAK